MNRDKASMIREAATNHSRIQRAMLRQLDANTSILLTDDTEYDAAVTDVYDAIRSDEFDRMSVGFAMLSE